MKQIHQPPKQEQLIIRIRGEDVNVPSIDLSRCKLMSTGRLLRTAEVFDEELVECAILPAPTLAIAALRRATFRADLYSFAFPFQSPRVLYGYPSVEDNLAVLSTHSYESWWTALPQESRKNVRLADKRGVVVRPVEFDDRLVAGIKRIYDETPIRQGRRFWHFGRSLDRVRIMNETYLDRSQFVGAYYEDELIGFIKYIRVDKRAVLIQILAMDLHREKRTIYALLREAVELCQRQGLEILTYGKFDYGVNRESSLSEFKRRNGFVKHPYSRYFAPITPLGRLSIATGLHLGWRHAIPAEVTTWLYRMRAKAMRTLYKDASQRNA